MKKAKKNILIGFAIFGIAYFAYLVLLIDNRNNKGHITYNSAISENTVYKIRRWSKTGVEIDGDNKYYFFPEYPLTDRIMEFCNAQSNPSKIECGSAKVYKTAHSNKLYFISDNDTLLVRMKEYK